MKKVVLALVFGAIFVSGAQAQITHFVGPNGVDPVAVSAANPLPVTGAGSSSNASVGTNSSAAPSSSTLTGYQNGSGNTVQDSTSTPHPVTDAAVETAAGAPGDTTCATDTGTCSIPALLKRNNQNLTTLNTTAGTALPAGTNRVGYVTDDPCGQLTKSGAAINLTASGQVITGTSAKKTYICSIDLVSASAQNIALVEGTGSVCATNIFGLAGGTTAGTGWNLAANGGLTKGNGLGTVYSPSADSNGTAANVCLLLSGSGQTSGQITYVQQ